MILQFLAFSHNEHEINEFQSLAKRLGVDQSAIKTAQVYDYVQGSDLIPSNPQYSRYEEQEGKMQIKNKLLNHCWKMWHSCVMTWDGQIVPCCFDKDASHVMGDIRESSFKNIWHGDVYNRFRSRILRTRNEIDICKNCSEGTSTWA